jgi:hypothetical protein
MGLVKKDGVFKPTAKGKGAGGRLSIFEPVYEELLLLVALLCCAGAMLYTRGVGNLDARLWVTMLSLQTLPYISAVASQLIAQMPDRKTQPATLA